MEQRKTKGNKRNHKRDKEIKYKKKKSLVRITMFFFSGFFLCSMWGEIKKMMGIMKGRKGCRKWMWEGGRGGERRGNEGTRGRE